MSPVTGLHRPASSIEACVAKSDIVCKTVDVGMTFLKKKKLTASNENLVYDTIKEQYRKGHSGIRRDPPEFLQDYDTLHCISRSCA